MKLNIIIVKYLLFISVFFIYPARCEENNPIPMSIEECIKVALKNNYGLIEEKNKLDIVYRKLEMENNGRFPTFYFQSANTFTYVSNKDNTGVSDWGVRISQPIYNINIGYAQQEALLNFEKEQLKYESLRNDVIFRAFTLYYTFIGQVKLLEISMADLEQSQKLYEIAQERFKAGDIAEIEVMKAQVQVAQSEDSIISSQSTRDTARDNLLRYLEMSFETNIIPTDEISYLPFTFTLQECLDLGVNKRPDLKSAYLDVELAKVALNKVDNSILPKLDLSGSVRYRNQTGVEPDTSYLFSVNGVWEIPLYDRGKRENDIKDSTIDLDLKKQKYDQVLRNIMLDVRNAYRDLKSLEGKIELRQKIMKQAEQNLLATQLQYKMGFATILDVTSTSQALTSARINALRSLIDFQLARQRVALLIGLIGDEWNATEFERRLEK